MSEYRRFIEGDRVTDGEIVGTVYVVHNSGEYSIDLGHTTCVRREEDLTYAIKNYELAQGEYEFLQYILDKTIKAVIRAGKSGGLEPIMHYATFMKHELEWQHEHGERGPVRDFSRV